MKDDLISRQAALKALRPIMRKSDYFYEILKAIQDVPPAEPERKTGKWIPLSVRHGWICSECRKENVYAFSTDNNGKYVLQDYFCPNCGADMRGKQNEH